MLSILITLGLLFIIWIFSELFFRTGFDEYSLIGLIATVVISVILSFTIVFGIENTYINRFINSWNANKAIYESTPDITKILTDIEDITKKNRELLDYQSDQKHWYGFYIPDEIQELEPISFAVEEEK